MSALQQPHSNTSANESPMMERTTRDLTPPDVEKKADLTPLFWRMFGASCMAIAASLFIVLYFQIMQGLNAIRSDVSVLREGYIQLVPKSEFSKGHSQITTDIQTMQAKNVTALEIWSARVTEQDRKIERMRTEHKEQVENLQRDIQQLRERLAVLENRTAKPKN